MQLQYFNNFRNYCNNYNIDINYTIIIFNDSSISLIYSYPYMNILSTGLYEYTNEILDTTTL